MDGGNDKEGSRPPVVKGRKKLVIKNGVYGFILSIISFFLSFLIRKVFVITLGNSYLGYEGLFSDIFGVLGTAEAGMVSLLYYALYKSMACGDSEETSYLMSLHRRYYFLVGVFVLGAGCGLSLLLPYIISDNAFDWWFVYKIYFIQLVSVGTTYFLTYKRTLFTVAQLGYECARIDGICTVVASVAKILVLFFTKSYYLYLFIGVAYNIGSNLIVSRLYKRRFADIKKVDITWKYVRERGFDKDLYNMLIGTLAGKVYSSTDNIVISKFLGVGVAGFYSNYCLIWTSVESLIMKLTNGVSPAVGNFVNTESEERILELYKRMNFLSYLLGVFIASSFATLYQPFISMWVGEKYLLPYSFVLSISVNAYISWNQYSVSALRGTCGHFEVDRFFYSASAIVNIVVSVALINSMGITGVVVGTIVGNILFWIGRAYVVHRYIIRGTTARYILNEVVKACFACGQVLIIVLLTNGFDLSVIGFIERGLAVVCYTLVVDMIVCRIVPEGRIVYDFIHRVTKRKEPE